MLGQLLPARGEHVHLLVGEMRLDARVEALPAGHLHLALPAVPYNTRRATDIAAQVYISRDDGVCRLLGRLRMLDGHTDHGVLVEFSYAGVPQLLLRREHVRADLSVPVEVDVPDGQFAETRSINISAGGLLVRGPLEVRVGQLVDVLFYLPSTSGPVQGKARVARVTPVGDVGFALVRLSGADQARLTLAVFEARRRARDLAG